MTLLWPPNHRYHDIDLDLASLIGAGPEDFEALDLLLEVVSSQPDNASSGDGNTENTIQIVRGTDGAVLSGSGSHPPTEEGNARASAYIAPGDGLRLRAERQANRGPQEGRTYTVLLTAIHVDDPTATHTVEAVITAPHNRSR